MSLHKEFNHYQSKLKPYNISHNQTLNVNWESSLEWSTFTTDSFHTVQVSSDHFIHY